MSTDKTGEDATSVPANDEPGVVRPAETLLHAHPADLVELSPEKAPKPDQPAYIANVGGAIEGVAALVAAARGPGAATGAGVSILKPAPVAAAPAPQPLAEPMRAGAQFAATGPGVAPKPAPPQPKAAAAAPPPTAPVESLGSKARDEGIEIAKTIAAALAIAVVLRVILFQPFTIPSASMEPNLYEGDYLVISKWNYGWSKHSFPFSFPPFAGRIFDHPATRGDIVVFKLPSDPKVDYIKRVIGLPGDQIQMINDQLYINGVPTKDVKIGQVKSVLRDFSKQREYDQADVYQETLPNGKTFKTQDFEPDSGEDNTAVYTVPAGYYFMMGDNRDNSSDSRISPDAGGVGFVPAENLEGKAQMILFSWTPGASLWNPLTWFTHLRPSRFFTPLK